MKKLSYALFGLAVLLSDVMCWVVGYRYSDMLWGIRYACYSAPAWTAWLTALPFLAGIAVCVLLGAWLRRKKPVKGQKRVDNLPAPCYNACNKGFDREK